LLGQIIAAGITALASAGAAFAGAGAANRNTKVIDERAQKTADLDLAQRMLAMACSDNASEAFVGASVLKKLKGDWNSDPKVRTFIIRSCEALNASNIQAYYGGATHVTTTPPGGTVRTP